MMFLFACGFSAVFRRLFGHGYAFYAGNLTVGVGVLRKRYDVRLVAERNFKRQIARFYACGGVNRIGFTVEYDADNLFYVIIVVVEEIYGVARRILGVDELRSRNGTARNVALVVERRSEFVVIVVRGLNVSRVDHANT